MLKKLLITMFGYLDPPGNATLQLNADQVIDLGFYRDDRLHSCTGVIGNPPQELILEILYANTTGYQELSGPILEDLKRNKTTISCRTFESITFGLRFSSKMKGAKIRCRPAGNINNDTLAEDSLFLIPSKLLNKLFKSFCLFENGIC